MNPRFSSPGRVRQGRMGGSALLVLAQALALTRISAVSAADPPLASRAPAYSCVRPTMAGDSVSIGVTGSALWGDGGGSWLSQGRTPRFGEGLWLDANMDTRLRPWLTAVGWLSAHAMPREGSASPLSAGGALRVSTVAVPGERWGAVGAELGVETEQWSVGASVALTAEARLDRVHGRLNVEWQRLYGADAFLVPLGSGFEVYRAGGREIWVGAEGVIEGDGRRLIEDKGEGQVYFDGVSGGPFVAVSDGAWSATMMLGSTTQADVGPVPIIVRVVTSRRW